MSRIGILGGSFDPIHLGHKLIAELCLEKMMLDEIWLMPTKQNPLKSKLIASDSQRQDMILDLINNHKQIKLCTIEYELDVSPAYTIDTLSHLTRIYQHEFVFIIGSDQLTQLDKWHEIDRLATQFQLVCFLREGYPLIKDIIKKYQIQIVEGYIPGYSSTQIRSGDFVGLADQTMAYISAHGIYLDTMIKKYMSEHRYQHSLSTSQYAKKLAQIHCLNENDAYVAGILHDIAKEYPINQTNEILKLMGLSIDMLPYQKHQFVGAYLAKSVFKVQNDEIINSIATHARPTKKMSDLQKLVFIADKLEPKRNYDTNVLREISENSLTQGFIATLEMVYHHLLKKGFDDLEIKEIIEYYKEELNG